MRRVQQKNATAHRLYLKGRYFCNKTTNADIAKAIEYFDQAIAQDPGYARAYAGLADAYLLIPFILEASPQECYPKAREAGKKAIELDDTPRRGADRLCSSAAVPSARQQRIERGLQLDPN